MSIVSPTDLFTGGVNEHGAFETFYIPVRPSNAGSEAVTGFDMTFSSGSIAGAKLHAGHTGPQLQGSQQQPMFGPYLASPTVNNPTGTRTAFLCRRHPTSGDVKVRADFHVSTLNGPESVDEYFRTFGVGARIHNGTATGTAPSEYIDNPLGYWFVLNSDVTDPTVARYQLLVRTAGSGWALIGQTSLSNINALNLLDNPQFLRMELVDSGADVQINCYTGNVKLNQNILVISALHTGANVIQATGTCGFISQLEQTVNTVDHVSILNRFEIEQAGAVVLSDRWERSHPAELEAVSAAFSVSGVNLGSDYAGGLGSAYGTKLQVLTDRLQIDPNANPVGHNANPHIGGYFFWQFPATDYRSQHRSIVYQYNTTGAEAHPIAVAVFLRGFGGSAASTILSGYMAEVVRDGPPTDVTVNLYRVREGVRTLLATAATQPYGSLVTDYELRFQVFNLLNAAGTPDAAVQLQVWIDDVGIVLVEPSTPIAGVTVAATGIVTDNSSARIIGGWLQGFRVRNFSNNTRVLRLDSWIQESLTNASEIPERDQVSIAIPGEIDDYTGQTFTTPLSWPVTMTDDGEVIERRLETGYLAKARKHPRRRRAYDVQVSSATDAEKAALKQFWDDHDGMVRAFDWVPIDQSTAIKAHFNSPMDRQLLDPGVNSWRFELEELLS